MRKKLVIILLGVAAAVLATLACWFLGPCRVPRASGPVPQSAFVWQRAWGPEVSQSVRKSGESLAGLAALAAEIQWQKSQPTVQRVELDYDALKATGRPIGLAIRIGNYSGPFKTDDAVAHALARLVCDVVLDATKAGLAPSEVQLDFDCGEAHLEGYRAWLGAARTALSAKGLRIPLTITVLPAWLKRASFGPLTHDTDGFVLQVHSVDQPSLLGRFTLCDVAAAKGWVEQAGRSGKPFRVALPTYGYVAVFDESGKRVALVAEGPALNYPSQAKRRLVAAEPADMAQLVREWTQSRPANMLGIIWYRLPVEGDRLNWRWPTLAAVMRGDTPRANLQVRVVKGEDAGLSDIELINCGDADAALPAAVTLQWSGGKKLACDGLAGYEPVEVDANQIQLRRTDGLGFQRLGPGETMELGWIRLGLDTEVTAHVDSQ